MQRNRDMYAMTEAQALAHRAKCAQALDSAIDLVRAARNAYDDSVKRVEHARAQDL